MELEYAPVTEEWVSPHKLPIRDYSRKVAQRHVHMSRYIPRSLDDSEEYADTAGLIEKAIDSLRERYQFRDEIAVRTFLRENFFLVGLLAHAVIEIQEYFGPGTPVALNLLREPDAKGGGRLFVLILTTLPPREAVARLDELDQGWWLEILPTAQGKLTIDIDYG